MIGRARFDRWAESVHAMQRYPELAEHRPRRAGPGRAGSRRFEAQLATPSGRPLRAAPARARAKPSRPAPGPSAVLLLRRRRPSHDSLRPTCPGASTTAPWQRALDRRARHGRASYAPFVGGRQPPSASRRPSTAAASSPPRSRRASAPSSAGWASCSSPKVLLARRSRATPTPPSPSATTPPTHTSSSTAAPHHRDPQSTTIDLHNGWTVRTSAAAARRRESSRDRHALTLLLGGALLSLAARPARASCSAPDGMRALSLVREKTRELSHQALHDALTGLPNRALVLDRAEQMLARIARAARACSPAPCSSTSTASSTSTTTSATPPATRC